MSQEKGSSSGRAVRAAARDRLVALMEAKRNQKPTDWADEARNAFHDYLVEGTAHGPHFVHFLKTLSPTVTVPVLTKSWATSPSSVNDRILAVARQGKVPLDVTYRLAESLAREGTIPGASTAVIAYAALAQMKAPHHRVAHRAAEDGALEALAAAFLTIPGSAGEVESALTTLLSIALHILGDRPTRQLRARMGVFTAKLRGALATRSLSNEAAPELSALLCQIEELLKASADAPTKARRDTSRRTNQLAVAESVEHAVADLPAIAPASVPPTDEAGAPASLRSIIDSLFSHVKALETLGARNSAQERSYAESQRRVAELESAILAFQASQSNAETLQVALKGQVEGLSQANTSLVAERDLAHAQQKQLRDTLNTTKEALAAAVSRQNELFTELPQQRIREFCGDLSKRLDPLLVEVARVEPKDSLSREARFLLDRWNALISILERTGVLPAKGSASV